MAGSVAIIGAGYAGLAAAIELTEAGIACDLFEASQTLGGRSRGLTVEGWRIDNGAHILSGAYKQTLRLMQHIGVQVEEVLQRIPLHLEQPPHFCLRSAPLPSPLHLAWGIVCAKGLPWSDKWAIATLLRRLEKQNFKLNSDMTVATLIAHQGHAARQYLWRPLCLAALNTDIDRASAQTFINVLRDSLSSGRAASDLLLPRCDLSALFPDPAARWLTQRGSIIHRGIRVRSLRSNTPGWSVDGQGPYRHIIVAVAPQHASALLESASPEHSCWAERLRTWHYSPISTVYLAYPDPVRLNGPMQALNGSGPGHWLFDRGTLCGQPGLLATVISGDGPHIHLAPSALALAVHEQIEKALQRRLPTPLWQKVIHEKRATFLCTPALTRPLAQTRQDGLWLAGDYVGTGETTQDYPATIESAVRSGVEAAIAVRRFC
jgi:squalene-associated FAD-dependent desaturase